MSAKPLAAGRLRHRIRIEAPSRTQDPDTGAMTTVWAEVATVAAAIEPLSANSFIAAQALKSKIDTRVVIRYRSGLNTTMRLVGSDGTIYTPRGFLHDMDSGRDYLVAPCSSVD